MTITRAIGDPEWAPRKFVSMPAALAHDPTISFAAKGLYAYLASLPPDAPGTVAWIAEQSEVHGQQAIRRSYRELQDRGWLVTQRVRDGRGALTIFQWRIETEQPISQQAREAS